MTRQLDLWPRVTLYLNNVIDDESGIVMQSSNPEQVYFVHFALIPLEKT